MREIRRGKAARKEQQRRAVHRCLHGSHLPRLLASRMRAQSVAPFDGLYWLSLNKSGPDRAMCFPGLSLQRIPKAQPGILHTIQIALPHHPATWHSTRKQSRMSVRTECRRRRFRLAGHSRRGRRADAGQSCLPSLNWRHGCIHHRRKRRRGPREARGR